MVYKIQTFNFCWIEKPYDHKMLCCYVTAMRAEQKVRDFDKYKQTIHHKSEMCKLNEDIFM